MKLEIKSKEDFPTFTARRILSIIERAVDTHQHCTVALSGGNTPKSVYEAIARLYPEYDINWRRVYFFWGDERMVDIDSPQSNFGMATRAFLDKIPAQPFNIFPFRTDFPLDQAASDYEEKLRNHFDVITASGFNLVLLGLGEDGHTLSIFPQSYGTRLRGEWVYGYKVDDVIGERLTLLPDLINQAEHILFLVNGKAKAPTVQKVMFSRFAPDDIPAQLIRPVNGNLEWLLDEEAAELIRPKSKASN